MICFLAFGSCKEAYEPEINTDLNALTVDGLITDSIGLSYIKLGSALKFTTDDSVKYGSIQNNATVYISDDFNNLFYFDEDSSGYYLPRDVDFKGVPGETYTLNIITQDGNKYRSSPQKLLPNLTPDSFYLKKDIKTGLFTHDDGSTELKENYIYKVCLDYKSSDNDAPRFRFNTNEYIDYLIVKPMPMMGYIYFYCWYSISNDDGLIFTSEKYPVISQEIKSFPVESYDKLTSIYVPDMTITTMSYDTIKVYINAFTRVIRINQYRINDDTYQFYKGMAKQSADEGKIFDPIANQLYGNIKCINDSNKIVLGFFEASPIKTITYAGNSFNLEKIAQVPNFIPTAIATGFETNVKPLFWLSTRDFE